MLKQDGLSLLGVNISGGEYGKATADNPGKLWTSYVLPTAAQLDYYAGKGMNVIRLPFQWERMQGVANGKLNPLYLDQIDQVVALSKARGMKVVLDLHNFGSGYGKLVGSADLPASALADLWFRLASHYAREDGVLFGLMNEPHTQKAPEWAAIAQESLLAIRTAGATTQQVLVPGTAWDGGHNWVKSGNAAALLATIKDPASNVAFEVHQYFDANNSGTSTTVVSPTIGVERLTEVTRWAEANGVRLFLGEFAAGSDPASLATLDATMAYIAGHNTVWEGATYWAGGLWWGSYPFSIEPAKGVDKPQLAVLTKYEAVLRPAAPPLPGFDAAYYLLHNPDVKAAGVDPAEHYVRHGGREGRNPSAVFDTGYYLARNPDVAAAGVNPLLHFTTHGAAEGRAPSLVFDPARYLAANPDVAAARMDALVHYTVYGQAEGRPTFLSGGAQAADPLVDAGYLGAQLGATLLPTGPAAAEQAAYAFSHGGWQARMNPNPLFDTAYYLVRNPDVAAAHVDPLVHFETYGWSEGRDPSPGFSTGAYLATYGDVKAAAMDPLLHFLVYGRIEGRMPAAAL